MSRQGESKDPWSDLARQLGEDAGEGGVGAAAGEALGEWSETRPFLPEETKREGRRGLADSEDKRPRLGREAADAAKAARSAKDATRIVGQVLAGVAAHTFLAGTAIVVCVLAFGATGVMLLKSTEEKSHDDVATVDLGGGDKSGSDASNTDSGSSTDPTQGDGVRGQAGADGSKAGTPTDAPPSSDPGTATTTTTARPRPTPAPTPGAPPPPDPTSAPTPEPTPDPTPAPVAPTITRYELTGSTTRCLGGQGRTVSLTWASQNATSATISPSGGAPVYNGGPNDKTSVCAPFGSTWVLTVTGPGGNASAQRTFQAG